MLSGRIAAATKRVGAEFDRLVSKGAEYELKRLFYEGSNATSPASLAAVAAFVPPSQIDYPFVPIEATTPTEGAPRKVTEMEPVAVFIRHLVWGPLVFHAGMTNTTN
jgi:hypothetical protein